MREVRWWMVWCRDVDKRRSGGGISHVEAPIEKRTDTTGGKIEH